LGRLSFDWRREIRRYWDLPVYVRVPWQAVEFYLESMDPDKSIAVAG
jgi:hypothetical protein